MAFELVCLTHLILLLDVCFQCVGAKLIVKPQNIEVGLLVNQSTYFNCSTSNTTFEIVWYHYAVGTSDREDVYDAGAIRYAYRGRFDIEKNLSTGAYNLIVQRPKLEDAGRYECQDIRGIGDKASAELIVLARVPVYQSNTPLCEFIGPNSCGIQPDKLHLSCKVAFHGNIPPQMQWKMNSFIFRDGVNLTISANSVTYTLSIEADMNMGSSSFVCETSRFANNQYSCHSPVYKVLHAITNYKNVTISTNEEVVCFVNSSQLCSYKWERLQGRNITIESSYAVLRPKKPGRHWCTAECYLREKTCLIKEAMSAFVFEIPPDEDQPLRWHVLWAPVIIISAVVGLTVGLCYRRRFRRKGDENSEDDERTSFIEKHLWYNKERYDILRNSLTCVQEIAAKMFESQMLTPKELEDVQQFPSTSIRATEELLEIIRKKSRVVYVCFLQSLKQTNQLYIHQMLIFENKQNNLSIHLGQICRNYTSLLENVDPEPRLTEQLYQCGVLTLREREEIDSKIERSTKNETLLSLISRKSPKDFKQFKAALENTDQSHVVKILEDQECLESKSEAEMVVPKVFRDKSSEKNENIESTSIQTSSSATTLKQKKSNQRQDESLKKFKEFNNELPWDISIKVTSMLRRAKKKKVPTATLR